MKKTILSSLIIGTLVLSSCSPSLIGTWAIDSYSVKEGAASGVNVSNIGTITFKKGNDGEKNILYSIFENKHEDTSPFRWYQDNENSIRIEGESSDFSKTWLIVEKSKKQQVWKSTNGANKVQELILKKQ